MNASAWTSLIYLAATVVLTVWVGHSLHRSGRIFLVDAFRGDERIADAVNRFLLVGYYLVNIGWAAIALRYGAKPETLVEAIEFFTTKFGVVLVVLGLMHFNNVAVLSVWRRRRACA